MWTSKTVIILLLVILKSVIGFAFDTNTELLSQILTQEYYLVYSDPDSEIGADRALNNDPLQASETLSTNTENVEWIAYFQIETSTVLKIDAVLLQMPETQVPNGSFKVVIGENPPCPGQSLLAQKAGGVFNCGGQSGEFIKVFCNNPPCGTLRIALIRAWTLTAVSFNATPLLWSPSQQIGTIVQAPERILQNRSLVTNSDIYSFTKEGSFLAPYWAYLAGMKDPHIKANAPVTKATLILQFNYRSQIKEVFFVMSKSQNVSVEVKDTNDYNIVGQGTFCANNQAFNITQTISCDFAGSFMLIWTSDPILYLNKVVVIGWDCGTKPLAITKWSNQAFKIQSGTTFRSFDFPEVSEGCVASYNKGYNVEYLDEAGGNSLYFITDEILATSRKIKLIPDDFNKGKFAGKILIVTIKLVPFYNPNFGGTSDRINMEAKFQLAWDIDIDTTLDFTLPKKASTEVTPPDPPQPTADEICSTSAMVPFTGILGVPLIYVFDTQPTYIQLPAVIKDTESLERGLQDDFCGARSYTISSSSPFAKIVNEQNATKVELQSQSRADGGFQLVEILVGLKQYPQVTPITISFAVNVKDRCTGTNLLIPTILTEIPYLEFGYLDIEALFFNLPVIEDSISQSYGKKDGFSFCGTRSFSISESPTFLKWASDLPPDMRPKDFVQSPYKDTIVARSNSAFDIGEWVLTVNVRLKDYAQISASFSLKVKVKVCAIDRLGLKPGSSKMPELTVISGFPSSVTLTMPEVLWIPNCPEIGATVQFQLGLTQVAGNQQKLPYWISYDQKQVRVDVAKADKDILTGLFAFEVIASLETQGKVFTLKEQFKVFFANEIATPITILKTIAKQIIEPKPIPEEEPTIIKDTIPVISQELMAKGGSKEQWDSIFNGLYNPTIVKNKFKPNAIPTPPKVQVKDVSSQGVATLKFDRSMLTFGQIKTRKVQVNQGRMLQTNQTVEMLTEKIFNVVLFPGNNSVLNSSDFDYDAWFQDDQTLRIQLKFTQPEVVSASQPEDVVELKFATPFIDQQFGLALDQSSRQLRFTIPPQAVLGTISTSIVVATQMLQVGSTTALGTNALSNIFLQGSLNQIWGMINNLQMVVNYPMINIQFPGNAFGLFNAMITIASFDFLPTDKFYPQVFRTPEVSPYSEKLDRVGISGKFIIMNMGTLTIFILWQIALYPIYLLAHCCRQRICCKAVKNRLHNNLFWNGTILLIQEAYLDICICGLINVLSYKEFSWTHPGIVLSNIVTILLLLGVIILPLIVLFYLKPHFDQLRTEQFESKFSSSYSMVSLKGSSNALWYCMTFYLRRVAFAASVIFLASFPFFQIVSLIVPTMVILIVLSEVRPMPTNYEHRLEIFDNLTIIGLTYILLCFTEFVHDPVARYKMGYAMIFIVIQNVAIHVGLLSVEPINKIKDLFKNRYAYWQRAKRWLTGQKDKGNKNKFQKKISTLKSEFLGMDTISEEESPRTLQIPQEVQNQKRVKQEVTKDIKRRQESAQKKVTKILRQSMQKIDSLKVQKFQKTSSKLQEKARSVSRDRKKRRDIDYLEPRKFYEPQYKTPPSQLQIVPDKSTRGVQDPRLILNQFSSALELIESQQRHLEQESQKHRHMTKRQQLKQVIRNWGDENTRAESQLSHIQNMQIEDSEDEIAKTWHVPKPKRHR